MKRSHPCMFAANSIRGSWAHWGFRSVKSPIMLLRVFADCNVSWHSQFWALYFWPYDSSLPAEIESRLEAIAKRLHQSNGWAISQALLEYTDEQPF